MTSSLINFFNYLYMPFIKSLNMKMHHIISLIASTLLNRSINYYYIITVQYLLNPLKFHIIFILILFIFRSFLMYDDIIYCEFYDPTLRKFIYVKISEEGLTYGKALLNEAFLVFKTNQNLTTKKAISLLFEMLIQDKDRSHWYGNVKLTEDIGHILMLRSVQAINEKDPHSQLILLFQVVFHSFTELNMNKALMLSKLEHTPYFNHLFIEYSNWVITCRTELKQGYLNIIYTSFFIVSARINHKRDLAKSIVSSIPPSSVTPDTPFNPLRSHNNLPPGHHIDSCLPVLSTSASSSFVSSISTPYISTLPKDLYIIENGNIKYPLLIFISISVMIYAYLLFKNILGILDMYDRYARFFTPRVNIVVYSVYLIRWLYVVYQNIILLLW